MAIVAAAVLPSTPAPPVLSVITITKNVDRWIDDCLRSILEDQGWQPGEFELVVVDDRSSDTTREI
ncbi:MAG: glycosyltransferase, partial [Cellulomonadaceae bacterium]|nr:glycosyltransferase [Cellulomonadaceae bacterium]